MTDPQADTWPELPFEAVHETLSTIQLWTQIVGKIRLSKTPWLNHSWHVALYVTARGLTTSPIPDRHGVFEIQLDFIEHLLRIETSSGARAEWPLQAQSVAQFHDALIAALAAMGTEVRIDELPNEMADPVRFVDDRARRVYDPLYANRYWRAMVQVDRVLKEFRTGFIGKASPVHLFWGGFDLAVTRFSGRRAPLHKGGIPHLPDAVTREAYSHEVSSAGFWPGGGGIDYPAFYSYAYPEPPGFRDARVRPERAFFSNELGEFILPYDAVRSSATPDETLMGFLQSTYDAAADAGHWPRAELECARGRPCVPRAISAP